MGFFDFLSGGDRSCNRFVTEKQFKRNLRSQLSMTPQTLTQLRAIGVDPQKKLKLEYFFYTNNVEKASVLSDELDQLGYSNEHGLSAHDNKTFVITGWSTKMTMDDETVIKWTEQMCQLGYKYDCDFDGWGTTPDQNE